mmetsp:Transcript_128250/g.256138  ORF Transcript_128250/g.256138 Transcript_128250/m.256138 type:complete len:300 (-) Transcript_128250:43-942(-)
MSILDGSGIHTAFINSRCQLKICSWICLGVADLIQILRIPATYVHLFLALASNSFEASIQHIHAPIQSLLRLTRKHRLINLHMATSTLHQLVNQVVDNISQVCCQHLFVFVKCIVRGAHDGHRSRQCVLHGRIRGVLCFAPLRSNIQRPSPSDFAANRWQFCGISTVSANFLRQVLEVNAIHEATQVVNVVLAPHLAICYKTHTTLRLYANDFFCGSRKIRFKLLSVIRILGLLVEHLVVHLRCLVAFTTSAYLEPIGHIQIPRLGEGPNNCCPQTRWLEFRHNFCGHLKSSPTRRSGV